MGIDMKTADTRRKGVETHDRVQEGVRARSVRCAKHATHPLSMFLDFFVDVKALSCGMQLRCESVFGTFRAGARKECEKASYSADAQGRSSVLTVIITENVSY